MKHFLKLTALALAMGITTSINTQISVNARTTCCDHMSKYATYIDTIYLNLDQETITSYNHNIYYPLEVSTEKRPYKIYKVTCASCGADWGNIKIITF